MTLKEGPMVKSVHTRRFPAHDFLYVGLPSQTSTTNNKRVISTFKFGYPHLTLKEGPKVKSVHTKRFPAHDFLYVGLPSQTSTTNNKQVISTFKFGYTCLTLKKGNPRLNLTSEDSQPIISYRLSSHSKPLGTFIKEIKALLRSVMWGILALCGCDLEYKASRSNVCTLVADIYRLYISPRKRFHLLAKRTSQ